MSALFLVVLLGVHVSFALAVSVPVPPPVFTANLFYNFSLATRSAIKPRHVFLPCSFSPTQVQYAARMSLFGRNETEILIETRLTASLITTVINGQCRKSSVSADFMMNFLTFQFLKNKSTKYVGTSVVDGKRCNLWKLKQSSGFIYTFASAVGDETGSPVMAEVSGLQLIFRDVVVGSAPQAARAAFRCPAPFYCPAQPDARQAVPMLRLQAPTDWSLGNKNTADFIGEAYYLCSELLGGSSLSSYLVSLYTINLNTSYSQYNQCTDEGFCNGALMNTVGRQYPDGFGVDGGQCLQTRAKFGTWYSLPVGDQGVSWSVQERSKSVAVACLLRNGLLQTCQKMFDFPFSPTIELLRRALTTDLCEDTPPPKQ